MKKILLFIIFAGLANVSFAQLNMGLKFSWTVNQLILNGSTDMTYLDSYSNDEERFGLNSGIMANYKLNHRYSLQSEILFDAVNTDFNTTEYYTNSQGYYTSAVNFFKLQMQYLQMPILGKISFGNKVTFDVFAGGFFAYNLSAKQSTHYDLLFLPEDDPNSSPTDAMQMVVPYPKQDVRDNYTNFNAGILAGCGVTMHDRVILEIRLSRGLVNINKADASKMYTLQGQFGVGYYLFRQKKKV